MCGKTTGSGEKSLQEGSGIKVGTCQSQFPLDLNVRPLHEHIPNGLSLSRPSQHREFWFQRIRLENPIPTFSPLSPRAPGAPVSPWKTTGNSFNPKHSLFQGIFPSLFGLGGSCSGSCFSFGKTSGGGIPDFQHLHSQNGLEMSYPGPWKCRGKSANPWSKSQGETTN